MSEIKIIDPQSIIVGDIVRYTIDFNEGASTLSIQGPVEELIIPAGTHVVVKIKIEGYGALNVTNNQFEPIWELIQRPIVKPELLSLWEYKDSGGIYIFGQDDWFIPVYWGSFDMPESFSFTAAAQQMSRGRFVPYVKKD